MAPQVIPYRLPLLVRKLDPIHRCVAASIGNNRFYSIENLECQHRLVRTKGKPLSYSLEPSRFCENSTDKSYKKDVRMCTRVQILLGVGILVFFRKNLDGFYRR